MVLDRGMASCIKDLEEVYCSATAESSLGGEAAQDNVINQIDGYLQTVPNNLVENKASKNSTKYRQVLIKEFLSSVKCKRCPRCNELVRYFRQEYSSRVYLKPLGRKVDERERKLKEALKLRAMSETGNGMF